MSKWAIWVFGLYECAIAQSLYLTPNYHHPESLLLTDAIPRHEAILAGKSLHETGAHYENLDLFALELLNVQCQSDPPTTSGGHDTIQDTGATLGITDRNQSSVNVILLLQYAITRRSQTRIQAPFLA